MEKKYSKDWDKAGYLNFVQQIPPGHMTSKSTSQRNNNRNNDVGRLNMPVGAQTVK